MKLELCPCEGRPEPHWETSGDFEGWWVFLLQRGVVTHSDLSERLRGTGGLSVLWGTGKLYASVLRSIWHMGGLQDDGEFIRRSLGEFDLEGWEDFDQSWGLVRSMLYPHPAIEQALWHPRLEEVRRIECDEGGSAFVRPR